MAEAARDRQRARCAVPDPGVLVAQAGVAVLGEPAPALQLPGAEGRVARLEQQQLVIAVAVADGRAKEELRAPRQAGDGVDLGRRRAAAGGEERGEQAGGDEAGGQGA